MYKEAMIEKIINICSKNSYQYITDFEWYINVLMELAHTKGTKHGMYIYIIVFLLLIREFNWFSINGYCYSSKDCKRICC